MFDTLADLMEHYKRKGIEEMSGTWVHLKQVKTYRTYSCNPIQVTRVTMSVAVKLQPYTGRIYCIL